MKVWRMQNAQGEGPYRALVQHRYGDTDNWQYRLLDAHGRQGDIENHPAGADDFKGKRLRAAHRFGFRTLEQALAWFDGHWLKTLADAGFRLQEVEAREGSVIDGRSGLQIIFIPA